MNLGASWSTVLWEKCTSSVPGKYFQKIYQNRERALAATKKSQRKSQIRARRWKRNYQSTKDSNSKKARLEYGPGALDVEPELTPDELKTKKQAFLDTHINLSHQQIMAIDKFTPHQSGSQMWVDERKKRITASNFGTVFRRNVKIPVKNLVKTMLYSTFRGNHHTQRGIQEEAMTIREYKLLKISEGITINVEPIGLIISPDNKHLAASLDGKVVQSDGDVGLLEIKNLLRSPTRSRTSCSKTQYPQWNKSTWNMIYHYSILKKQSYCKRGSEVTTTVKQDNRHQSVKHFDSRVNPSPFSSTLKAEAFLKIRCIGGLYFGSKTDISTNKPCTTSCEFKGGNKDKQEKTSTSAPNCSSAQQTLAHTRSKKITCHNFNATSSMSFSAMIRYSGTVLDVTSGKDGDDDVVYDILYDGDDEAYTVDHLVHDYHSLGVKFIGTDTREGMFWFFKRNLTLETWKLVCSFKPFQ
ncbi:hypothetical protein KUTeg_023343, partial [Tegillarca granosa]